MIFCSYCGNEKADWMRSCCGENHFEESEDCPECGSGETIYAHGFTTSGVETSYVACSKCNHQWGHQ